MDAQVVLMSSALSEEFVRLRSTLLSMDPVPRSVAVLGASGQEGASLVAARLALSFASVKSMGKVLLAEGNVRQSMAAEIDAPLFANMVNGGRTAFVTAPLLTSLEGGVPLRVEGQVVGAIGVSGVKSEQDAQVAKAGAAAL